jgi:polyisoprenyl-teichoic acid--peptidoglycan teichoic acid transferase
MTLLNQSHKLLWHRIKRRALQHLWLSRIVLLVVFFGFLLSLGIIFFQPIKAFFTRLWTGPKMVTTFFSDPLYVLPSSNAVTNVLFLGMGGEEHDGGELTDTMIFASLNLKNTDLTMLSIPRDIWVPSIEAKINAAYAFGEKKEKGSGYVLIEDAVYEIIGQPIHYIISLDFESFVALIDTLGGVEVEVERSFRDEKYPIKGRENDDCGGDLEYSCRYQAVEFKAGKTIMDGETALIFSRSRHAKGEEGTDFARSLRQQKIIASLKDKVTSSKVLLNPVKLFELKKIATEYVHLEKEISDEEYAAFASFAFAFWRQDKQIRNITLETGTIDNPGFLINPPLEKYGQWVLEPRGGNWKEFQAFFRSKILETY